MPGNWVTVIPYFPRLLYHDIPAWWLRFMRRLLIYIDNRFAVRLMLNLLLVPVWQDTSVVGRLLSLIYRLTHVAIGCVLFAVVTVGMMFWLVVWFVLPIVIFIKWPLFILAYILAGLSLSFWVVTVRKNGSARRLLEKTNGDIGYLWRELREQSSVKKLFALIEKDVPNTLESGTFEQLVSEAQLIRSQTVDSELSVLHLTLAALKHLNFHFQNALEAYLWSKQKSAWSKIPWIWEDAYPIRPIGGVNRDLTGIPTPELNSVSRDLTQLAVKGKLPELIGRKKEIEEIVRILGRKGKENVLIVGESGSGKTTLVEGLAYEIIRGTEYKGLRFKRLLALDTPQLTAGTPDAVKVKLVSIIKEMQTAGNVILFIDEIHTLLTANEGQSVYEVYSAFEPHLDAGEFEFVATTTPTNFKKYIEPDEAFLRTFRVIHMQPASAQDTLEILKWKASEFENKYHIGISYASIQSAVELAARYIHDRVLPDSAIDLLEEAVTKAVALKKKLLTSHDVADMVTEKTSIPVATAETQDEQKLLLHLEEKLHQRIVGQDEAVTNIANALRRARAGMSEEGRLIASFLFAGATGVGKTETAKALAAIYFGSEKQMVRLDMSEYQTPESINRLIGPPPGNPGFEAGGQLTEAVRRQPFSVILLDEIEKASPNILDVFLQVLDDARLTDSSGKTVDFSNTMLIATTNIGTKALIAGTLNEQDFSVLKTQVLEALRSHYRLEFLNRFTGIVVYRPLSENEIQDITRLILIRVKKNLQHQDIWVEFSEELIQAVTKKGFSREWGAREINRVVRDEIEDRLAKKILTGELRQGNRYQFSIELLTA